VFRGLLAAAFLTIALTLFSLAPVYAVDPSPAISPGPSPVLVDPLDPRAGGGAPSVGAPFAALVVVVGVGALAAAATFAFVRVTRKT
jgi:hypothetical protein